MQMVILPTSIALLTVLLAPLGHSETLAVVAEESYVVNGEMPCKYINAVLLLGGDSIMFLCPAGFFARFDSLQPWRKLMDCVPYEERVPFSVCDNEKDLDRLILPKGLWRISGEEGDEILLLEGFCSNRLYSVRTRDDGEHHLKVWRKRMGNDNYSTVSVQGDLILCGMPRFTGDKAVVLQRTDRSDYERVWVYPLSLAHRLDSVGCRTGFTFCIPAFNPKDSTLLLAIQAYDYLYVTDMKGEPLDSLHISGPDYRLPPPIKSRIKSLAVLQEWKSHWTEITSFVYVAPGYFHLQYLVGREEHGEQNRGLYSTFVLNTDLQPVSLDVDKLWRLVGVQPDGRLIYSHWEDEGDTSRVVLTVARIEP